MCFFFLLPGIYDHWIFFVLAIIARNKNHLSFHFHSFHYIRVIIDNASSEEKTFGVAWSNNMGVLWIRWIFVLGEDVGYGGIWI